MVDVDLNDVQILTTLDVDLAQVSYVKEIKSQNTYLKYGLILTFLVTGGLLIYLKHKNKKNRKDVDLSYE